MDVEKLPVPFPISAILSVIAGFCAVLQQTPRSVTVAFPSEVTLPPSVADVSAISEALFVVTIGTVIS